jgi:hypothetical protein
MMVTLLILVVAVVVAGLVGAVARDNPFLYALLILDIQGAASSATMEIYHFKESYVIRSIAATMSSALAILSIMDEDHMSQPVFSKVCLI